MALRRLISLLLLLGTSALDSNAEEIAIGGLFPLTGNGAEIGEQSLFGAQLAVDEINSTGGINGTNLKLVVEDSQSEPRTAVSAYKKLVDIQKPAALLVQFTAVAMATRPLAERDKLVMIAGSTHPALTAGFNYTLRNFVSVKQGGTELLEDLKERELSKLAVLHVEDDFAQAGLDDLVTRGPSYGVSVVGSETFTKGATDLRSQILRLNALRPDALYILGIGPAMVVAFRQSKELGINVPRYSMLTCAHSNVLVNTRGSAEGVRSLEVSPSPVIARFEPAAKKIHKKFADEIPLHTAIHYDAVMLIAEALRTGAQPGEDLRQAIVARHDFDGSAGPVVYHEPGNFDRPLRLMTIANGRCVKQ